MNLLGSDEIRDEFVERLSYVHNEMEIELYCWVVMPDHVHLIVRPLTADVTVPKYLQMLKRTFAYHQLNALREHGRVVPRFWLAGGGYDRNLWSRQEFDEKVEYIHDNPVRAGLVDNAADWRWSSAGWPEVFWTQP